MTMQPETTSASKPPPLDGSDRPELSVSTIIPVYNAERFLDSAIESVIQERQSGIAEIILVEDGSTDGSMARLQTWAHREPDIIRIAQHPDSKNHGAGASRNLGIQLASAPLVCFLDADDYWLPGRLDDALRILKQRSDIHGVFDETTIEFESANVERETGLVGRASSRAATELPQPAFFRAFILGDVGWNTDGIVLRRSAFDLCGLFEPTLRLRQDSQLWIRMAATLKLVPSASGHPVAVYRRHRANRFQPAARYLNPQAHRQTMRDVWDLTQRWFRNHDFSPEVQRLALEACMRGLGRAGCLSAAWRTSKEWGHPAAFLWALRTYIPGPRRLVNWLYYRLALGSCKELK